MGETAWSAATRIPTEGRSSVSAEQRENLDAILRQSAFPADIDVGEQRRLLRELISAQPLPAGVTVTAGALGGVPTAEITVDGIESRHVVLYFHGGVYVLGDAFLAADLASQVGRRPRAKVISVDYRLAPEHPYPAAVDAPSPPWSTPETTDCPCQPQPSSCHRMPTSPWPERPWKPSARSTR